MWLAARKGSFVETGGRVGRVRDTDRIAYLHAHLDQVACALADGAQIRAYSCWSLLDSLECEMAWGQSFALINVDYQTLNRTVKESGWWYRDWTAKSVGPAGG